MKKKVFESINLEKWAEAKSYGYFARELESSLVKKYPMFNGQSGYHPFGDENVPPIIISDLDVFKMKALIPGILDMAYDMLSRGMDTLDNEDIGVEFMEEIVADRFADIMLDFARMFGLTEEEEV